MLSMVPGCPTQPSEQRYEQPTRSEESKAQAVAPASLSLPSYWRQVCWTGLGRDSASQNCPQPQTSIAHVDILSDLVTFRGLLQTHLGDRICCKGLHNLEEHLCPVSWFIKRHDKGHR